MRARIYDALIARMTGTWYRAVLERVAPRTHLLDVGIGTGRALLENRELLDEKDLRVTGLDIDAAYVAACAAAVQGAGLEARVAVRHESVYDHRGGPYGAVYFSASFMLLPDPEAALQHVASLLEPRGRLYFTQTFEHRRSRRMERVKPLLRRITSIDFGRVTYEEDFRRTLAAGGLEVLELATLHATRARSAKLAVALPGEPGE